MKQRIAYLIPLLFTLATALILYAWGRPLWCEQGDLVLWTWDINSSHNSQHILDPYTFSHILHGFLFLWIFILLRIPPTWRFSLAVALEAGWELLENTNFIIERYRAETFSLNYYGDSVLNSVADIGWCAVGFVLARALRWPVAVAVFVLIELTMIWVFRDCLSFNIIMLIYPVEALRQWQVG